MGLGGVAIAVLPSMIYPKQPFSDGLGGGFFQRLVLTFITMKGSTHPFVEVYRPLEQPQNVGL